jgi:hypothetical protein
MPGPPSPESTRATQLISWVKAEHNSIRGKISVQWKRTGNDFDAEVKIPTNTTAAVAVPSTQPLPSTPGVRFREIKEGCAWLEVASGTYRFHTKL